MNNTYVVRVTVHREEVDTNLSAWMAALADAGVIYIHGDDAEGTCFDILPPRDVPTARTGGWAFKTSEKLQAQGINGVKAPAWPTKKNQNPVAMPGE